MALMRLSKIALTKDEQGIGSVSRLGAGLLGIAALALCFQVLRSFDEEVHWHFYYWPMYRPKFWAAVGSYGFLSLILVFLGSVAYACLYYAFAKRKGTNYAKSAVWASGAVFLESILSQLFLVVIVGAIYIHRLPPELRADAHFGWVSRFVVVHQKFSRLHRARHNHVCLSLSLETSPAVPFLKD